MSYALQGLGAVPLDAFPTEERNGLFWVKESVRAATMDYIGSYTEFGGTQEGNAVYGTAFVTTSKHSNWVAAELAKGRAIAVKPASSAAIAVAAYTTDDPYELVYNTAKSFGGTYAILAAPAALVAEAVSLAAKGPTPHSPGTPAVVPTEPATGGAAKLPKWVVPAVVGTAVVAAIALLK